MDCGSETLVDHIKVLEDAIAKICINKCGYNKNGLYYLENERSFAYELYRTWTEVNKTNLVINAEISKHIQKDYEEEARCIFGKDRHFFVPDLVLHHSQYDSDEQEIICEIKIKKNISKDNFIKDIKKLHSYTKTNGAILHPFRVGVLIFVGGDISDLKSMYNKEELNDIETDKIKIIVCNVKDQDGFSTELYGYDSIIN